MCDPSVPPSQDLPEGRIQINVSEEYVAFNLSLTTVYSSCLQMLKSLPDHPQRHQQNIQMVKKSVDTFVKNQFRANNRVAHVFLYNMRDMQVNAHNCNAHITSYRSRALCTVIQQWQNMQMLHLTK